MNNPTKQATALSYNEIHAPTITAQGEGEYAEEIISLAKKAGILIHEDPHLSNFLKTMQLGEEIPKELYLLVSELIAFVYVMEGKFPERWDELHSQIVAQA